MAKPWFGVLKRESLIFNDSMLEVDSCLRIFNESYWSYIADLLKVGARAIGCSEDYVVPVDPYVMWLQKSRFQSLDAAKSPVDAIVLASPLTNRDYVI